MEKNRNSSLNTNLLTNQIDYQKSNIEVKIYSAFETSKENIDKVVAKLSRKYNFTANPVNVIIDESLIGGIKVVFDSIVIDGTIKGKLKKIKQKSEERI